jgi:hypothetical protein
MDQTILNEYFGTVWHSNMTKYKLSGPSLIDKIAPTEFVIDVGCGDNYFKGKIRNIIGIDPANNLADVKCTIEEFSTDMRFDVAFCLGSINFGNVNDIERQISKLVSLLKQQARIYWRCNPGLQDHPFEECKLIEFYPWSLPEHIRLAEKYGFRLMEYRPDENRIYAEWVRQASTFCRERHALSF